ncbi:hypothetical protein GCM10017083_22960 [Thalassobaculum fulvum]|uniref:Uncharacterized protein n=1 Tax=Thalassobaculum fulvum TaxID=1633335 RepID=A0A919CPF0_9PROT|nr:hypothetical protein [Thalassobaculum fulvum]GHD49954.1 hypothetical protein GCM10017083_22960 [Thalassobaculum fulvum]
MMNWHARAISDGVTEAASEVRFDAGWYVEEHGDVPALIERGWFLDPLHHYLMAGCREGKSPNPEFQEDYYRTVYPDIAKAIDENVFNCGFEHYLKHGRTEGRRFRPATRGALVDLTRYHGSSALQERILAGLVSLFGSLGTWDFWLLTSETNHDALSRLDSVNVSRICLDRIVGDVMERWKGLPIEAFVAPLGPSDFYGPAYRTVTILPAVPPLGAGENSQRTAELERALGISEVVLCLTLSDRANLINNWYAERDRIQLLHLPPSTRIAGEQQLPMALRSIAGRRFMVTDMTGTDTTGEVALAAAAELATMPGEPCLIAVVAPGAVADLRSRAAAAGGADNLILVEDPAPAVWRWLVDNCTALLETGRSSIAPGLLEDAVAFRRPLVCSQRTKGLRGAGEFEFGFDVHRIESVGLACRAAFDDPATAAERTAAFVDKTFAGLSSGDIDSPLQAYFDRIEGTGRAPGPPREVLLGVREGNRIHGSFWFALPPSAAARSLVLEIAVPTAFPEPSVEIVASLVGQPETRERIARGRSERLALSLPPTRISGRVSVTARRSDGNSVKVQPNWPGLELRAATVLSSGINLLRSSTGAGAPTAANDALQDTDLVVSSINAAAEATAWAVNELEAAVGPALAAKPALRLSVPGMPSVLRAVAPLALHLTRHQFLQSDLKYHGSNKDQAARQQYLRDRGFRVVTEAVYDWRFGDLIERLDSERHADPHVIILEAMLHHPLMRYLRERFPNAKILVRSHNAEVPHRIDTHTAALLMEKGSRLAWLDPREAYTRGRNVINHWRYDVGAIKLADHILSISQWETERYWPKLGPRQKVSTVPYFMPRDLVYDGPLSASKAHSCVCLTSASPGPVIYDALRNFVRLVEGLDDPGDWDFPVTGDLDERYATRSTRCRFVGRVENPIALMSEATSMALLSTFGYGFKTKILDAISAGCYTLMPQSLLDRHPVEVHPYCLPVDLSSPASFKAALERSLEPFPEGDPNEALRLKAYAAMDTILGLN